MGFLMSMFLSLPGTGSSHSLWIKQVGSSNESNTKAMSLAAGISFESQIPIWRNYSSMN
jgi:hypothetical protein